MAATTNHYHYLLLLLCIIIIIIKRWRPGVGGASQSSSGERAEASRG